jgi:hypothetical protein
MTTTDLSVDLAVLDINFQTREEQVCDLKHIRKYSSMARSYKPVPTARLPGPAASR